MIHLPSPMCKGSHPFLERFRDFRSALNWLALISWSTVLDAANWFDFLVDLKIVILFVRLDLLTVDLVLKEARPPQCLVGEPHGWDNCLWVPCTPYMLLPVGPLRNSLVAVVVAVCLWVQCVSRARQPSTRCRWAAHHPWGSLHIGQLWPATNIKLTNREAVNPDIFFTLLFLLSLNNLVLW